MKLMLFFHFHLALHGTVRVVGGGGVAREQPGSNILISYKATAGCTERELKKKRRQWLYI